MPQFEIYWSDLTDEAKERLSELYHENVEISPFAVIETENVEELSEEEKKASDIEYIKSVIDIWGDVNITNDSILINRNTQKIKRLENTYISTIDYYFYDYEDLNPDVISEIREIVERFEEENNDAMEKASGYEF